MIWPTLIFLFKKRYDNQNEIYGLKYRDNQSYKIKCEEFDIGP